jgi:hypothetical protein
VIGESVPEPTVRPGGELGCSLGSRHDPHPEDGAAHDRRRRPERSAPPCVPDRDDPAPREERAPVADGQRDEKQRRRADEHDGHPETEPDDGADPVGHGDDPLGIAIDERLDVPDGIRHRRPR